LSPLAAAGLPMVCANPDLVVMRGAGTKLCAGALADFYEELGGPVARHGKPYGSVFDRAFQRLGISDRSRVAMIGDTFHTDIAGGLNAGCDAIWVAGGIHAPEVGYRIDGPLDREKIAALLAIKQPTPTAVIGRFI
jgi:HAD superfamily hydrolase (TIGR01459 family)